MSEERESIFQDGYDEGYDEGWKAAREDKAALFEIQDLMDSAHREGHSEGYDEAYDAYERETEIESFKAEDAAYWLEYDRERGAIA